MHFFVTRYRRVGFGLGTNPTRTDPWTTLTVKIKMFNGVVRVLSNVRHVPNPRKNLISLGVLDGLGYSYSSKGGIIKITKGALMVMKGQSKHALQIDWEHSCSKSRSHHSSGVQH